ncbi:MAG: membrane protein insertase YidC [Bacteroidales bacterium]|nr:MAG: membrane protein insertase YidC [Bacteroidales bacterium]
MDKNTIIGILLIIVIFIGFSYYNKTRVNKAFNKEITIADSLYEAEDYDAAKASYLKALAMKPNQPYPSSRIEDINRILGIDMQITDTLKPEPVPGEMETDLQQAVISEDTLDPEERKARFGVFGTATTGEKEFITLENDLVKLKISTLGGRIYSAELKEFTTHNSLPLILFDGDSTAFGFKFFTSDNRPVETNNLYFTPQSNARDLNASSTTQSVALRLMADPDTYIEYVYTLEPNKYMIDFDINIRGMTEIIPANQSSLDLNWEMYLPQQEKGRQNEDIYTTIKYKYYQGEVDGFRERSQKDMEENEITTRVRWMAFKDQFFSSVLIADNFFLNAYVRSVKLPESEKYLRNFRAELSIPYEGNSNETIGMKFYYGPNHFNTLKKYEVELEELVFLGRNIIRWINQYVIISIFNWLNKYIANYGIIILLLTIIIKMVLFPLTWKSYMSQAKMRVLKPQVDEINTKFPKKEDAMKKQQATMALYKRAGVSPMGGCLPMLLQMPILFAMFRFFPASLELRQKSFLWADDLSTYDSILDLPFKIPMYGDHVSLFTLLMTVSTIVTMKINSPSASGGAQMPGMKGMMYIMPIMFMLILNNFSAGLTYYYFLANLITFGQNLLTKQFVDEDAILKKLEENKKKPVKKSKWQKRLEEASKQRGVQPRRK